MRTGLLWLLLASFAVAQVPTPIRSFSSLPATCNGGSATQSTDMGVLISGGNGTPNFCVSSNTWQALVSGSGTTGVAALNLRDKLATTFGQHVDTSTIYRWSGIGLGPKEGQDFADYMRYMRSKGRSFDGTKRRISGTKTLIIDEVSMLPGRTLEFVDYVCREMRGDPRPFGGIQVIAVGDFLQLPPVGERALSQVARLLAGRARVVGQLSGSSRVDQCITSAFHWPM